MTTIEPAPFTLPSRYVLDLRALAQHAQQDAQEALPRIADEVTHRLPVNVHRLELLARNQHVAAFAESVLAGLESCETGPANPPLRVAEGVASGYRIQHLDTRRTVDDLANRALLAAVERVLDSIRATQAEDEQQYDNDAETDRRVVEHEQYLADLDAGRL